MAPAHTDHEPGHEPGAGTLPSLETLGRRSLALIAIGAAGYGALLVWGRLNLILLPLALGIVLASLLQPAVDWLERGRVPRWAGGVLVPVLVLLGFVALLVAIAPALAVQVADIGRQVTVGVEQLPRLLRDVGLGDAEVQRATQDLLGRLQEQAGAIGSQLGVGVLSAAQGLATAFTTVFLTGVVLIYLLVDGRGFGHGLVRLLPAERRSRAAAGGARAWRATALFTRGQVLVAALDGVGIGVGLWLVGVPLALPIGVLTFVVAFIPYVGAIVAGFVAGLVALSTGGPDLMLAAGAVALVVQQLEGNVLYPLIMGRTLSLHPLAVLLAVGVGSAAIGLVGAFLATPLLAALAAGFGFLHLPEKHEHRGGGLRERWRRRAGHRGQDTGHRGAGGDAGEARQDDAARGGDAARGEDERAAAGAEHEMIDPV